MVSLKLKNGTPVSVERGFVTAEGGGTVSLYEQTGESNVEILVLAYQLAPGETVRREKEGEYVIEF